MRELTVKGMNAAIKATYVAHNSTCTVDVYERKVFLAGMKVGAGVAPSDLTIGASDATYAAGWNQGVNDHIDAINAAIDRLKCEAKGA